MKSGVRIVFNRLLNGWYIVRGPHQTPLGGRFDTKAQAEQHLRDQKAARDARTVTATCTPEMADFIDPTGALRKAGLLVVKS